MERTHKHTFARKGQKRAAEKAAKDRRARLWKNYKAPVSNIADKVENSTF